MNKQKQVAHLKVLNKRGKREVGGTKGKLALLP